MEKSNKLLLILAIAFLIIAWYPKDTKPKPKSKLKPKSDV